MGKIVTGKNSGNLCKGSKCIVNIGMGILTPADALKGGYKDSKCPFRGDISIRGRVLRGTVVSTKMDSKTLRFSFFMCLPKLLS